MDRAVIAIRIAFVVGLAWTAACFSAGDFQCANASECVNAAGDVGFCESNSFCSFADSSCPSGRRYADLGGGPLAGQCTAAGDIDASPADAAADSAIDGTPCVPDPGGEICNGMDDNCNMIT